MKHNYTLPDRRRVADVMTEPPITVAPSTPFAEIAECFDKHRIGSVPVVDVWGRILGVVSEADLMLKTERQEPRKEHWFATRSDYVEDVKARGAIASELMTTPAITVERDTALAQAARLMHERHVKHLPVVDEGGQVLGVISRGDIIKVFIRPDEEIRDDVLERVIRRALFLDPAAFVVDVAGGQVRISGRVERRSEVAMIAGFVAALDGVVSVNTDQLTYSVDDHDIHNVELEFEVWRRS